MKIQFTFLMILLCVNLTSFVVMGTMQTDGVTPVVPGVKYAQPLNATGSLSEYEEHFNVTKSVEGLEDKGVDFFGIFGLIGTAVNAVSNFYDQFKFLIDGVPALLDWFGSFLPVQATAFTVIAWAIRIITGVMFVTLILEFISGRELMK